MRAEQADEEFGTHFGIDDNRADERVVLHSKCWRVRGGRCRRRESRINIKLKFVPLEEHSLGVAWIGETDLRHRPRGNPDSHILEMTYRLVVVRYLPRDRVHSAPSADCRVVVGHDRVRVKHPPDGCGCHQFSSNSDRTSSTTSPIHACLKPRGGFVEVVA